MGDLRNSRRISVLLIFALVLLAGLPIHGASVVSPGKLETRREGVLVVATSGNFPPFSYVDERNQLVGYDIDWVKLIADALGYRLDIVTLDWKGLLPGLIAGTFDIVASAVLITAEREEQMSFPEPYAITGVVTVGRADDNSIQGDSIRERIKGRVVGVITGSTDGEGIAENLGGYKALKTYPGYAEMFTDLSNRRIDVVVTGSEAAGHYVSLNSDKARVVGEVEFPHALGLVMRKDQPTLVQVISEIIREKKADGTYDQLCLKWFGFTLPKEIAAAH